jgi:lipid-binding SYLF domain-containing protein
MKFVTALPVLLFLLAGCSSATPSERADERRQIDTAVNNVLPQLYRDVPGSQDLAKKAQGVLVFPDVYKGAIGVGGEYGKGALRVSGNTAGYYSIASGSVGLQLGAQTRNIVFMFMTPQALADFRGSSGWQAGATAGVAWVKKGAEGSVDTSQINAPVLAFVFGNTGLIADVSVAGTKISKLEP